jgi:hypothetical protein
MSMYRLAVLDAKPFSERFRFDLEVNHWGTTPFDVEYDGVVYFYARPGLKLTPIATSPELYRIPEPPVPEPTDVPEGPYACGSG